MNFLNLTNIIKYDPILNTSMKFGVMINILPDKGNLVYEYNPFRNYRLSSTGYIYDGTLFTPRELLQKLDILSIEIDNSNIDIENATDNLCLLYLSNRKWSHNPISDSEIYIPSNKEFPTLLEKGQLTDFETSELSFDIHNPVNILPLWSYDGSVNLIINDGKNKPRLINSRFSPLGKNQYLIVDRKGNNDTNIYDLGNLFNIDTSLYKLVIEIPELRFLGITYSGTLKIGNYHFYFRYSDADGNETDFVAESGLVSIFIGTDPGSIRSGFRDENSHKGVQFLLSNIDSSYQYVNVYYTKSSSDIYLNSITQAYKIDQKFIVNNLNNCEIIITGYENTVEISVDEINPMYLLADSIVTLTSCLNMLFIGNIQKPEIPYKDLEDIALRFLPLIEETDYDLNIDYEYNITSTSLGYYDPKYIYNKTGYWNNEYYRLGIVYILSDGSLSPVFNIRGCSNLGFNYEYTLYNFYSETGRNYITVNEENYKLVSNTEDNTNIENAKGVVYLNATSEASLLKIYGIKIQILTEALEYLLNVLKIKGFFFVRQKRIPTILCLAYTISTDSISNTPILPVNSNKFIAERFITDKKIITHTFKDRQYTFNNSNVVNNNAAICPEYDINSSYLNTLFSGDEFCVSEALFQPSESYLTQYDRHFTALGCKKGNTFNRYISKIIGVEDNTKLVAIDNTKFSARAGEAEEAFRFEFLENINESKDATNLIRGSFGPYLGTTGINRSGVLVDIKIPKLFNMRLDDLLSIRYNDKSPFYAISDRISISNYEYLFTENGSYLELNTPLYRGDCYICQFTHRVNRNFQDPSSPFNDKIVDSKCWKNNFDYSDGILKVENFDKINLGDVNAVLLGMWVTFTLRSSFNLNIRNIDDSNVDEISLFGHPRSFYPYSPMLPEGSYKIPEALCYNKGFSKLLSERYNFEVPDVPAIKNDFTNRIAYSEIHVNDAFKNGFRIFQGNHYRDYPKTYGLIIKLVEYRSNLMCIFEHGIALIPVNERTVAGEGAGGNIYINTSNVLPENPIVISDTFGSQWGESIIKTQKFVYGVDTIGKKIWRTDGQNFECISDFAVLEFLNNNITLSERELEPIIGIRNVKTHYNKFKQDIMFTFYDNLYGFEEKVWNLCYNELLNKWITFYSWVPSSSENIYNLYFSFDRNTSKWIAKLGISNYNSDFADGITLTNNIIPNKLPDRLSNRNKYIFYKEPNESESHYYYKIGELKLSNRTLPSGLDVKLTYELEHDNYKNYKNFIIIQNTRSGSSFLCLKYNILPEYISSEFYVRGIKKDGKYIPKITDFNDVSQKNDWIENCFKNENYIICKDERGRRLNLLSSSPDKRLHPDRLITLLNIKVNIAINYDKLSSLAEAIATGFINKTFVDAGYYLSTVAVTTEYNKLFLTTDFWKHGLAGIIDISDEIYPTYWYGKLHPFEFEFIVSDNSQLHKIFDNLEIISNNAEPESFHYEIIGDSFDFSNDKKNMYIRLEATKELYQYNGFDVTYDPTYIKLNEKLRPINDTHFDKSTIMPLYYSRLDSVNEIEDLYHLKDDINTKDFSALAGGEIVRYKNLDEYRIWNHAKAINLNDKGRMRGNMHYKEDKWYILINPINIVQKNELKWANDLIPIEINLSPIPNEILQSNKNTLDIPKNSINRDVVAWKWLESLMKEVKMKDKWIKIRIRYKGDKLAIITAIKTLYTISYG